MKIVFKLLEKSLDQNNKEFIGIFVDINLLNNLDINIENELLLEILDHYAAPFIAKYKQIVMETDLNISALIEKTARNTKKDLEFTIDEIFENDIRIKQVTIRTKKESNAALIMKTISHQQYTIGFKPGIFAEKPSLNN